MGGSFLLNALLLYKPFLNTAKAFEVLCKLIFSRKSSALSNPTRLKSPTLISDLKDSCWEKNYSSTRLSASFDIPSL
ncbi:CLUMA_CG002086, isoform A [Clunio marinus]|uniref:CLUMA_CG002086, isoform A n=1 Tax=Clunio marinus TaxID=568069 RepID=A0A1J1HK57_9DIPT|nr:CLUMA_CG002086, isoform A [Clunio marinus]